MFEHSILSFHTVVGVDNQREVVTKCPDPFLNKTILNLIVQQALPHRVSTFAKYNDIHIDIFGNGSTTVC